MTLTEFLLARIAEDETQAKYAQEWLYEITATGIQVAGKVVYEPARVLAECAAKRRIVELHDADHECSQYDETLGIDRGSWFVLDEDGCSTVRLLAAVYSDHLNYDQRWSL